MAKIKTNDNLLDTICEYIERFVVFPHEHQVQVLAAWVIHTWAFEDIAKTTPYLYLHSNEPQSGKSLLLDVLTTIVADAMATIDATGPVIFRAIEAMQPTLMFDEVDAIWSGAKNEGLRGVLNGGYKLGGKVYRLKASKVVTYNTFCPKLLSGIHNGKLPDTLVDRCIPITMRRKKIGVGTEPFMASEVEEESENLKEAIEEWVNEHYEALQEYRQHPVEGLSDRGAEISWPLLAIANEFGTEDEMAEAIVNMIDEYKEMVKEIDKTIEMLRTIGKLFEEYSYVEHRKPGRLHTHEILTGLGMNGRADEMGLAAFLGKNEIEPYKMRIQSSNNQGYSFDQFEELFDRYDIQVSMKKETAKKKIRGRNSRNRVSS